MPWPNQLCCTHSNYCQSKIWAPACLNTARSLWLSISSLCTVEKLLTRTALCATIHTGSVRAEARGGMGRYVPLTLHAHALRQHCMPTAPASHRRPRYSYSVNLRYKKQNSTRSRQQSAHWKKCRGCMLVHPIQGLKQPHTNSKLCSTCKYATRTLNACYDHTTHTQWCPLENCGVRRRISSKQSLIHMPRLCQAPRPRPIGSVLQ